MLLQDSLREGKEVSGREMMLEDWRLRWKGTDTLGGMLGGGIFSFGEAARDGGALSLTRILGADGW